MRLATRGLPALFFCVGWILGYWSAHRIEAIPAAFEPAAVEVARAMLRLAQVEPGELVADLGCGDGRIVVIAARDFGARGLCVERDAVLVAEAKTNARLAGVADRIEFVHGDLFEVDWADADVVTVYLTKPLNRRLEPLLRSRLARGSRVVSLDHEFPEWRPGLSEQVRANGRDFWMHRFDVGR